MRFLYWVRRDLRLLDNQCLTQIPAGVGALDIVIQWPSNWVEWGEHKKSFYLDCLRNFAEGLQGFAQELRICEEPLSSWLLKNPSLYDGLIISRCYSYFDRQEELAVTSFFSGAQKNILWVDQGALYSETQLPFSVEDLPTTFTAFRKKIEKPFEAVFCKPSRPHRLPPPGSLDLSNVMKKLREWISLAKHPQFSGGEDEGLLRLQHYLWNTDSVARYKETRNGMIAFDDSTKFSPWLAWGCLSPRTILFEIKKYESDRYKNDSTYWVYFELLWRDYFKWLALLQGPTFFSRKGLQNKKVNWKGAESVEFQNWKMGKTGQPFIDANMRELLTSGWMSNRGRQNVASYLAKTLEVDWTAGARWFENLLIDYDPESNWGNWAYLAGVGVDPRDRVFNIERQASIYDPEQIYQKKFLGE